VNRVLRIRNPTIHEITLSYTKVIGYVFSLRIIHLLVPKPQMANI
jgi:hypothetical protein